MNRLWIAPAILATAGLLASCGGDETAAAGGTDGASLQVDGSPLGSILVDAEEVTVYMFTRDSPGTSVCEAGCLEVWPPVEGELSAGEGVDDGLIGTIERSDGTVQATYADWPLYYFAQDRSAGDINGQGVDDAWYVLTPEGEPVREAMPTEAPPAYSGGY